MVKGLFKLQKVNIKIQNLRYQVLDTVKHFKHLEFVCSQGVLQYLRNSIEKKKHLVVYFCADHQRLLDQESSVGCDMWPKWYHFSCEKIVTIPKKNQKFFGQKCKEAVALINLSDKFIQKCTIL